MGGEKEGGEMSEPRKRSRSNPKHARSRELGLSSPHIHTRTVSIGRCEYISNIKRRILPDFTHTLHIIHFQPSSSKTLFQFLLFPVSSLFVCVFFPKLIVLRVYIYALFTICILIGNNPIILLPLYKDFLFSSMRMDKFTKKLIIP